ncbi:outer membrane protein assembly factor BamC [Candidatus Venteria ishoeyi]|uniref:Lipoprotein n=1 Tax=Candidatus Venteria ishoeyi TaxID=1899563 RepID=A0A1H6FH26_9GAMM|nr:outer membrane protein assembly factor BamC [Candidatus Venteria ishoeyi]MDM8545873.1 outer membrane protein assembly factor BamC [Candidatus Venteria ishoeyi]SEH08335.1 lipoprotein [Candidatus Venteria ishoeyi]
MKKNHWLMPLLGSFLVLTLTACGITEKYDRRIEYKKSHDINQLEIPPDLDASMEDELVIPGGSKRNNTLTGYEKNQAKGRPGSHNMKKKVLPIADTVQVLRDGNSRWLRVKAPVDEVWPKVKTFWLEAGFLLKRDHKQVGIMETEWTENRADIPQDLVRRTLGKALDFFWEAYTRDKFRTRLEHAPDNQGQTEIFLTHRGAEQVSQGENFVWQYRPTDPELEVEMLNRMMVYLGLSEEQAVAQQAKAQVQEASAVLEQQTLRVRKNFMQSWRLTGLALDRSGFSVEDRNRAKGLYYVRYVPQKTVADNDKGWLDSLAFWRGDEADKARDFQIKLDEASNNTTQISVLDENGKAVPEAVSVQILQVLLEQLR